MNKVTVVGLGYIGLPTALVVANAGFDVIGYDIDETRVAQLNCGQAPIFEPGLAERLASVRSNNNFSAQTKIAPADYFIIAVPTPCTTDKKVDLSAVYAAVQAISTVLKPGNLVILESTVPVGTTALVAQKLAELSGLAEDSFLCAYCPERVLPGKIFHELLYNSRVLGGTTQEAADAARRFYARFVRAGLHGTVSAVAEMVKLVENSARDVQIAFAHEVAELATAAQIDPYEVIALANKHPRINILQPRCGVGGHCIAIDPFFLIQQFPAQTPLLQLVRTINDARPHVIVERIKKEVAQLVGSPVRVLLLGLTYKPDVDDLRESPAVLIARRCLEEGMELRVCDPYVQALPAGLPQQITFEAGLLWADLVVCLVGHRPFKERIEQLKKHGSVLDTCGILYEPVLPKEPLFWPAESCEGRELTKNSVLQEQP